MTWLTKYEAWNINSPMVPADTSTDIQVLQQPESMFRLFCHLLVLGRMTAKLPNTTKPSYKVIFCFTCLGGRPSTDRSLSAQPDTTHVSFIDRSAVVRQKNKHKWLLDPHQQCRQPCQDQRKSASSRTLFSSRCLYQKDQGTAGIGFASSTNPISQVIPSKGLQRC